MIDNVNIKFKDWCTNDITIFKGSELNFLTSVTVWSRTKNKRTNSFIQKLNIVRRLDIYTSTNYCNWLCHSCFFALSLSPPNISMQSLI